MMMAVRSDMIGANLDPPQEHRSYPGERDRSESLAVTYITIRSDQKRRIRVNRPLLWVCSLMWAVMLAAVGEAILLVSIRLCKSLPQWRLA